MIGQESVVRSNLIHISEDRLGRTNFTDCQELAVSTSSRT